MIQVVIWLAAFGAEKNIFEKEFHVKYLCLSRDSFIKLLSKVELAASTINL